MRDNRLNREIGLIGLTFVAVGSIIGSGWLFAPLLAANLAGPASIISWFVGGAAVLLIALTFAEISAMLPFPGGIASVPQFSHGNIVSMTMGWFAWIGYNAAAPTDVEAMLRYLAINNPWLYDTADFDSLSLSGKGVAAALLVLFVVLNAFGVRLFAYINTTLTWVKIAIPIVISVALIYAHFDFRNFVGDEGFAPTGAHGVMAAISAGGIALSFVGFRHAIDMAGEARNPQFTIPAALILAIVVCSLIYVGLQVAFVGALSETDLKSGWSSLTFVGGGGPLAAIAQGLGMLWLVSMTNVAAVISPLGSAFVSAGSNGRLALALTTTGILPSIFRALNRFGVPLYALFLNLVITSVMVSLLHFHLIIAIYTSAIVLSLAVGPIALMALRRIAPHYKRSFRVPAAPVVAGFSFVCITLIVYWSGWETIRVLALLLALGVVMFFIRYRRIARDELDLYQAAWLVPFIGGIVLISWLGNFGGGLGILRGGVDILACIVLSLVCFAIAVRTALSRRRFEERIDQVLAEIGYDDEVYRDIA
ncbi:APC family permease [Hoeflea sp. TYP-13]|uniref:APC family permease n=1 Tax=Hoeflea sp. TYP-13 TaxID=3230023 RepID=UPI0034C62DB9